MGAKVTNDDYQLYLNAMEVLCEIRDSLFEINERGKQDNIPSPLYVPEWKHGCDAVQHNLTLAIARCPMCGKLAPEGGAQP